MSFSTRPASASCTRRKHFTTLLSNTVVTDYQMPITVYKTTGTDDATHLYLGADVQDDFDDFRSAKGDQSTEHDVWKEDGLLSSGTSVPYWIEVHKAGHSALTGDSGADAVFDVADGTVFAADDWVCVYDDDTPLGEVHQIDSISTNEITLKTVLSQSYTIAQNAKCCHMGYIYYEDATATDPSSGAATFVQYEGYDWGADGDDISDSGGSMTWSELAPDAHIETDQSYSGDYSGLHHPNGSTQGVSGNTPSLTLGSGYAVRFRVYKTADCRAFVQWRDETTENEVNVQFHSDEQIGWYNGVANQYTGSSGTINQWELIELNDFNIAGDNYDIWLNGSEIQADAGMRVVSSGSTKFIYIYAQNSADCYYDDFIIRKFTATEPTFGAWGAEEEYSAGGWGGEFCGVAVAEFDGVTPSEIDGV